MRAQTWLCRSSVLFTALALVLSASAASALPGELAAVERHCGNPSAESSEVSQVNNRLQRTLYYDGNLLLHFEPAGGDWSFTTGWHGNFPITRNELDRRLPCFRDAMAEVAAAPITTAADPTIALNTRGSGFDYNDFGIPHVRIIILLAIIFLIFLILPTARKRQRRRQEAAALAYQEQKAAVSEASREI